MTGDEKRPDPRPTPSDFAALVTLLGQALLGKTGKREK